MLMVTINIVYVLDEERKRYTTKNERINTRYLDSWVSLKIDTRFIRIAD